MSNLPRMSADAQRPLPVLLTLVAAGVAFSLSQTLVVPALPALAREFDASPAAVSWVLTGFLLAASIATPIVGKLGDLYGKGRVLTATLLVFSAGAVINALANSIGVLIAGRVLQGVAGGVFPLAFGIVRDTFPREQVPSGLAIVSAIFGIGGGIGLPLSGVIVDNIALSWLFWISLLALPAALAAYRLVPPSPPVLDARVDWPGALLLSGALAAILLGVTRASDWGWGSTPNVGAIAGGLVLVGAFLAVERRVPQPLIDLDVLRKPAVAATNLTGFLVGLAMFSSFLIMPQFAQAPERTGYGFGFSVTAAGLLLMPTAISQLLAGPLAARLAARLGFRAVLSLGAVMITLSFAIMTFAHSSPWELVGSGILLGAGITFAFAAMANLIVEAVPQAEVGIATGINTVMRTVGGSFGAAISTAILTGSLIERTPLPTEGAYTAAFAFSTAAGLLALAASRLVPRVGGPLVSVPARAASR
jgi:EmrB/QacA subfamily drug resistance transporter